MQLHWHRLHDSDDHHLANANGTEWTQKDEGGHYTIRTTIALLRDKPYAPYRISDPDGYIIASGFTLEECKEMCETDAPHYIFGALRF